MSNIFEILDRNGKKIRLTEERWKHISQEHPDVSDIEEIKSTIEKPTKITSSIYDPTNVDWYYRFNKAKKKYLFVAVKYLNRDGFIITSFYVGHIK